MKSQLQRRTHAPRRVDAPLKVALAAMLFVLGSLPLFAQSSRNSNSSEIPENASELARENLKHVAASAAELEAILHKDAGLLVELKSWIAKRATEQGQVVTDSDLTDVAIFERLRSDVEFRSVATRLVQRYGYLTPQVNPLSQEGREQVSRISRAREVDCHGAGAATPRRAGRLGISRLVRRSRARTAHRVRARPPRGRIWIRWRWPIQPPNLPANTPFNPTPNPYRRRLGRNRRRFIRPERRSPICFRKCRSRRAIRSRRSARWAKRTRRRSTRADQRRFSVD